MTRLVAATAVALLAIGAAHLTAADGLVVVTKRTSTGDEPVVERMWLTHDHLRTENKVRQGVSVVMIFDAVRRVNWTIFEEQKRYMETTQADLDELAESLRSRHLPPPPKTIFRKTGVDRVGAWMCDVFEGTRNDAKTSELCTLDPSVLGVTAADLQVLTTLRAHMNHDIAPYGAEGFFVPGSADNGYSGLPIRAIEIVSTSETTEMIEVTRQPIPDSLFQVPAGYTKIPSRGIKVP